MDDVIDRTAQEDWFAYILHQPAQVCPSAIRSKPDVSLYLVANEAITCARGLSVVRSNRAGFHR